MVRSCRLLGLVLAMAVLAEACFGQDAELQKKINQAIEKGVAHLKDKYKENYRECPEGMNSIIGWTLLEMGVDPKDKVVQEIVRKTREDCINLEDTYALTLAILFLDKLGDPWDEPVIQCMAARLLSGQSQYGSWDYKCFWTDEPSKKWLKEFLATADKERNSGKVPAWLKGEKLADDVLRQIKLAERARGTYFAAGDNSNTQFAMLGLWVSRRHHVPKATVDDALHFVVKYFRECQHEEGSWGYKMDPLFKKAKFGGAAPHTGLTCAGLLALAFEWGISVNPEGKKEDKKLLAKLQNDIQVAKGLKFLANQLKIGEKSPKGLEEKISLRQSFNFNYFLFSMERMAVVYKLEKIGGINWYEWGARYLVETQKGDNWDGSYQMADTCFALLFLKRANVARDLGKKVDIKIINLPGFIIEKDKKVEKRDTKPINPEPEKRIKDKGIKKGARGEGNRPILAGITPHREARFEVIRREARFAGRET